jgi:Double zinc ribbon
MDLAFAVAHAILPLSFLAIWLTSVAWAYEDARRCCGDPRLVRIAVGGAIVFPLVGPAVYALLRPCRVRADERERRVWRRYLESQLEPGERCLACLTPLQPEFRCCPGCGDDLKTPCRHCGASLRTGWAACPECLQPAEQARLERAAA